MSVTINIMSNIEGEIRRFLGDNFDKVDDVDNGVVEWIYIYRDMTEAIKTMDCFYKSHCDYDISFWIQLDDDDIIKVTNNNILNIKEKLKDKMNILSNKQ